MLSNVNSTYIQTDAKIVPLEAVILSLLAAALGSPHNIVIARSGIGLTHSALNLARTRHISLSFNGQSQTLEDFGRRLAPERASSSINSHAVCDLASSLIDVQMPSNHEARGGKVGIARCAGAVQMPQRSESM